MYYAVFPLSEYNLYDDDTNKIDKNDICIICWTPSEQNNKLDMLKDFTYLRITCKCNPKIHKNCIDEWIINSSSCPICRKKLLRIDNDDDDDNINKIIYGYILYVSYIINLLKLISYISMFNLCCLIFYNTYFFFVFTNDYLET